MKRITEAFLEAQVRRINLATKAPLEAYSKTKDGKFKANVGSYHLSYAYGGVSLHRMENQSGGIDDVFNRGYMTKKELSALIDAFLRGVEL